MAADQKVIYVYDDFSTSDPVLMGMLYVNVIKGGETYSFEYNDQWLKKTGLMLMLDPELMPYSGRQYPVGKKIFGLFSDASPDRWGRVLMNKRERILAEREGRKPSKLHDSDYLLGVYDETRMGGIRFKKDPDGHSFQMIRRQPLRHGRHFVHWRRRPETLKRMRRGCLKGGLIS